VAKAAIAGGCPKAKGKQGLPLGVVRGVMKSAQSEMRDCYLTALEKNQVLSGQIELAIEITPWGDVFDARIRNSSLPNPRAQECVLDVVRTLHFPALHGGGTLQIGYPVAFQSGN
jgi:TonB family protein